MTQATLNFTAEPSSLTDRIAAHFRAHPGQWISMQALAAIGGTGGWRTRVSDARRQYRMRINNRVRRRNGFTISEYQYLPDLQTPERREGSQE